ncbi:hypothetical protein ABZY93_00610 [Streptomyces smyrnaeus]|uniref:hypothetical protein n=1 Tax=Streptomyces smyrnaeus TaxID=1387713 RepID=UPI0033BD3620
MTAPSMRRTSATVLALAFALALPGCSVGGDDGAGGSGDQRTQPSASSPAPGRSAPDGTGSGSPSPTGSTGSKQAEEPPEGGEPKGGVPRPEEVDQKDADAVAEGTLTAMWTYDTTVDRGPHDAGVRTANAGWLTEKYTEQLRGHRARSAPGAQWDTWAQHRAYTTVELAKTEDAAKPADTDTEAWRQWTVTTTPHGRDGWQRKPTTVVAYVHLVRAKADAAWRVAGVTVR